jgi:mRNA-degrading endonuclease toxin of MazEF toxin-antitoxin module
VLCGQIRTVSKQRLGRRLGVLPDRLMNQVDEALRLVLDL